VPALLSCAWCDTSTFPASESQILQSHLLVRVVDRNLVSGSCPLSSSVLGCLS
jgi:hypothetical protein